MAHSPAAGNGSATISWLLLLLLLQLHPG